MVVCSQRLEHLPVCWILFLNPEKPQIFFFFFTPALTDINLSWFIETQDLEKLLSGLRKKVKFNPCYTIMELSSLPSQFIDLLPCRSTNQQ